MEAQAFREPRHPPIFERIVVSHLQDPSLPATLGSGPVGFTLSGVPIYGPFTEAGTKVGILCARTLPTCPFSSVSDEWGEGWWGRLLHCAMWRLKHTVMAEVLMEPTHGKMPHSVLCLPLGAPEYRGEPGHV